MNTPNNAVTSTSGNTRPANVQLGPGAMQNWSDLAHHPAGASAVHRSLIQALLRPEHRVAVVGPHALDLITGIAPQVEHLRIITRSIPDGVAIGHALAEYPSADVLCASAAALTDEPEPYDLVIALDDLARVWSLECEPMTWEQVYDGVRRLVQPAGTLLLGVENELGLHRITSLRSRYTSDRDEDWSVTATFDSTRPRSADALADLTDCGSVQVLGALPTWQEQTVLVSRPAELTPQMNTVLGAVTLGSSAFRRVGADPTRVTRAAVLSGRLVEFASGWVLVAGPARSADLDAARILVEDAAGRVVTYREEAGQIIRQLAGVSDREMTVSASARSLAGLALDACAGQDLAGLRAMLSKLREQLVELSVNGVLPAEFADARLDNVLVDGENLQMLAPADADRGVDDTTWDALADLVQIIRARGSRHPWPVATDDTTMLATLGAMVGLPSDGAPQTGVPSEDPAALPAHDVPGLLAVIDRLTDANAALASRSRWFEERLNVREREMRTRAERHSKELESARKQQRILQDSAEDLRRSITYRAGAAIINPIRKFSGNQRP